MNKRKIAYIMGALMITSVAATEFQLNSDVLKTDVLTNPLEHVGVKRTIKHQVITPEVLLRASKYEKESLTSYSQADLKKLLDNYPVKFQSNDSVFRKPRQ